MTQVLCACAVADHLEDAKKSKKAPHFIELNFLMNHHREKRFLHSERRADLQTLPQIFLICAPGRSYDLSQFRDIFTPFSTSKDHD